MADSTPPFDDALLARVRRVIIEKIPHNRALGLDVLSFGEGCAVCQIPYDEKLVGNPATGVLHGGAITALMDATCGAAVFAKILRRVRIATLDLRIDYMKPAAPGQDVVCSAECYRTTKHIAFVRGVAYHDDPDAPIASVVASFAVMG